MDERKPQGEWTEKIQKAAEAYYSKPMSGVTYPEIKTLRDRIEPDLLASKWIYRISISSSETTHDWFWQLLVTSNEPLGSEQKTHIVGLVGTTPIKYDSLKKGRRYVGH